MLKKLFVIVLLVTFSGCALFQPTLREQLLPMEMIKVEGGTFLMGDVIKNRKMFL